MNVNYPSFIQFIGTQRSGSNLLRVMLNQLNEVSAPHPPHILKTFFPLLPIYGDLYMAGNFRTLVEDICTWVNVNPVPWEGLELHPSHIEAACKYPTLMEIFIRIYEAKARLDGANYCCCKSMESVNFFQQLEKSGLKPYYIHIFRDGRDVALSFMKAIVGPKHIYFLAKKWREEQELSLQIKAQVQPHRFISIRYEDLIHFPSSVMNTICEQIGVPFTEDVLDFFHSHESLNTAHAGRMWSNLSRPIMENNFNKFERELTSDQLKIFENVAGDMLSALGYTLQFPKEQFCEYSEKETLNFASIDKQMNAEVLKRAEPEELERRYPQERLLKMILSRKSALV